jgi:ubiquinone/menaquinone biosynthesis C-methylase UbiE
VSRLQSQHAEFTGSIPAAYDRYLGPMLFQPYAEELAARLHVDKNGSILELACGTGILTRVLRTQLPSTVKLTATDLNEPMFRHAAAKFGEDEAVRWLQADACSLPFDDRMFDAVVCQFGIMFVPDKALAERDPLLLPVITKALAQAITDRFGETDICAPMRAIVVQARV